MPDPSSSLVPLRDALRAWHATRVLVYGDIMLDEYIFGRADRLSPEKPVPVVTFERQDEYLGGAGNVVRNLHALGCEPVLVALVGDDATAHACREGLEALGLETDGIVEEPGRVTPRKIRVHAGQHALVRIDYEKPERATPGGRQRIEAVLKRLAPDSAAAVISDYRKGTVSEDGIQALAACMEGRPIVADPKGKDIERYRGVNYLLPNEGELNDLLGADWDDDGADRLREKLDLAALVVTRSERGIRFFDGTAPRDWAARSREVYDVTGAGDTFAGVFAAFVACGSSPETAARLANLAAGIKVRKVGTATVSLAEIEDELARSSRSSGKLLTPSAVAAAVAGYRARGETIVFTNGCFDLLHAGHIKYLEASRSLGDCLIVGLNSDRSVARLKKAGRPILDEAERAQILGALSSVDHVVIFEGDTPIDLIEAIRPDVLTKGADYEPHEVVGGDRVRSWGGRVEIIDLVDGKSTSDIIGRITAQTSADN